MPHKTSKMIFAALATLMLATPLAAADARLLGRWRVTAIHGAAHFDPAKTIVEFAANGRFASTVGCNRIFGAPTLDDGAISFGGMGVTRRACPGPLAGTETAYLAALEATRTYSLTGSNLAFFGEGGDRLVTLTRAK